MDSGGTAEAQTIVSNDIYQDFFQIFIQFYRNLKLGKKQP